MNKEIEQKAINIAKELCGLSDEELLNLPKVDDYDFIDDLLNVEVYIDKTDCKDTKDFIHQR